MKTETLNTIEKDLGYEFLKNEINEIILNTPKDKDKKEYLFEVLSVDYGNELSKKLVGSIPNNFFDNKEEEIKKEPLPIKTEKKNEAELEEKLIKEYKLPKTEVEKIKKDPQIKKFLKIGVFTTIAFLSVVGILNFKKPQKETSLKNQKENNPPSNNNLNNTISIDNRFDGEIYARLPEGGKAVYRTMAEMNPTPDRGYQILDKESAKIYVFDSENKLITEIKAGFGKDDGDEPNTSIEYNEGNMTTPAGGYLISNYTSKEDIKEYGELQFSLVGISIIGDTIYLGEHQTYNKNGEFEPRTRKLESPAPDDNKFSNGCINISKEDFSKYIKPNFQGDYGELMFVLQDKKSRESGSRFDPRALIEKLIPMMIEMANEEMNVYSKSIAETKDSINILTGSIQNLEAEYNRSTSEYQKDKNTTKEKKVAEIKNEIKEAKERIAGLRELLDLYTKKIQGVTIKRNQVEKILLRI